MTWEDLHPNRDSGAFYAQLDHQTLDSLKLIGGVQVNAIENIDPDVVPRGGVIWRPIDHINVKGLYGEAFRAPSLNEIGLRHPELWGQPDLRPEKVHAIDAGVSYLGEQINGGANYFYTIQNDIIMVDTAPSPVISAPTSYNNLGEVQIQGVELELKYYVTNEVYLGGSGLYFVSEDGKGNEDVTPIPNLGAKAGVSYMSDNGLTSSVFYIYEQALDAKYSSRLNPDPEARHWVNAYVSFDVARVFEQRFFEGLSLFVEGDNLLDREVFLPDWGGIIAETIPVHPGRTLYFGVSASVPHEGN
jgi:outer membrane receptor protein involved in Fe transport